MNLPGKISEQVPCPPALRAAEAVQAPVLDDSPVFLCGGVPGMRVKD